MTKTEPLPERSHADPHRSPWVTLSAVVVAVLVVAGAVIAAVVIGDDEPATAAPLSQVQASCRDWMDSASADAESDDQWCTDMLAWMDDRPGGSMMDNMMWQGPAEMGRACREWVSDERGETGATGPQQCAAMIEWMDGHMSSQGGRWMMRDR